MDTESQPPSLSEMRSRMREDVDLIREAVGRETAELRDTVLKFVDEHPFGAVGAAFGVGFVLAGGLFSRTTARVLGLSTRFVIGRFIEQALVGTGLGMLMPDARASRR